MNDKIYWIWLQQALGINVSIRTDEITGYFETAKSVYFAGEREWRISGVFTPRQLTKLENRDLKKAQNILDICAKNNWQVVTPDDGNYPSMLFKLPNFPLVLYVRGDLDCLKNKITVAVVGTRKPTRNSATIARALTASITRSGGLVVSGGALGIDSAAHCGALDANGKTVAVLGCGLNCNYPVANDALRNDISKNGAVITEYPPDTQALPGNFPIRNRIISGLSYGTLVIEAGEKSGSLITANYALEQGRDVYAVPGDIVSAGFTGANRLIRDGAKPVFNAMDVLEDYAVRYPELIDFEKIETKLTLKNYSDPPSTAKVDDNPPRGQKGEVSFIRQAEPPLLSENARKLYRAFTRAEMQADELILNTGLGVSEFTCAMTELELFDIVELQAGKNYKLK
ncbi:MAG: DNA-processing protein DprA [Clostridia bacterium]|nr:DNA-processing protein DprA [Clostridia bacterium]